MSFLSSIETVSTSPLLPEEVVQRLRQSVLPLDNGSWRDDYQINPAQPFEGTVSPNGFAVSRISLSRVRSQKPLTIRGWVRATSDGTGSLVRLRYYQASMLWMIVGMSVMAASFCVAAMLQDVRTGRRVSPLGVIYFTLPICAVVSQYYQIRNEMALTQPMLTKLLLLKPVVS